MGSPTSDYSHLIPGKLAWHRGLTRKVEGSAGLTLNRVIRLSDFAGDENLRGGVYRVPHYAPEAVGAAWGPLALDQTLAFCSLLVREQRSSGFSVVATERGSVSERANMAVLLGAFLIAAENWSVEKVAEALPQEAGIVFPCSWSKPTDQMKGTLTVHACWLGLAMARDLGWFPRDSGFTDDFTSQFLCSQYRRDIMEYDMVWLAPKAVLVSADPMTVIKDPNPTTCKSLAPVKAPLSPMADLKKFTFESPSKGYVEDEAPPADVPPPQEEQNEVDLRAPQEVTLVEKCAEDSGLGSRAEDPGVSDTPETMTPERENAPLPDKSTLPGQGGPRLRERRPSLASTVGKFSLLAFNGCGEKSDAGSAHTVCKGYEQMSAVDMGKSRELVPPEDFVTWCLNHNVSQITRVNFSKEPGLKSIGGSYREDIVKQHGIHHQDVPVADYDGGVPGKADIRTMLRQSQKLEEGKALLVHCKGGFGRSVVMACCHTIARFDVPGLPMLGWARIVRPGAITTVEQEQFLAGIGGADELERLIGASGKCWCKFW